MNQYAADSTNKAIKKFDDEGGSLKRTASSIADTTHSFVKDAKENVTEAAQKGIECVKNEGAKDLGKAQSFIKENPVKSALYALGAGALLSFLLLPRR